MKLYNEIQNSFPMIEKLFTKEDLSEFKNAPLSDLYRYHLGLGIWIRNNLLCPKENLLYSLFLESGIKHKDEMSSFIIKLFHYNISEK